MDRRALITVVVGSIFALPLATEAQQVEKVWRIAVLADAPPAKATATDFWTPFVAGMRELGYVEGQNMAISARYAEGNIDRFHDSAAELSSLRVDAILAIATGAALAAKKATSTIPIVFANVADPLGPGLVKSLARPGGNITGLSSLVAELGGKRLELLKEALPRVSQVAVLWNSSKGNTGGPYTFRQTEAAGLKLGLQIQSLAVAGPSELERALEAASQSRAGAVLVQDGPHFLSSHATQIVDLAARRRLPIVSQYRNFPDAGGLLSYGNDLRDHYRHAARYIDKILKGAKPGDLPVEQPTKFELVINLKTAKQLGLAIPQTLLLRADQVIE